MDKIDFVILWVDGNDPVWQKERNTFLFDGREGGTSTSSNRFRDWDILHFWFRAVEKYAAWVNNIYFVTYGHIPKWLNVNNKKLKIVNHKDFIPAEYLPTFNSNTIILNLHRIKGLSDKFVLFNDDMFILDYVKESDFFLNGLPRDSFAFNALTPTGNRKDSFNHMMVNNLNLINIYFKKSEVFKNNFFKILNYKNGIKNNLKSLCLFPWSRITGFVDPHIPYSYLKKNFSLLWEKEYEILNKTCLNKFRSNDDITDWVVRYMQLCKGEFIPRKYNFGAYYEISNNNKILLSHIEGQKSKLLCINDVIDVDDESAVKLDISSSFSKRLNEKSSFEK